MSELRHNNAPGGQCNLGDEGAEAKRQDRIERGFVATILQERQGEVIALQ